MNNNYYYEVRLWGQNLGSKIHKLVNMPGRCMQEG